MTSTAKLYIYVGGPIGAVLAGRWLYKKLNINVPVYDVPVDLKKKVFIITGANTGIGKATVQALAPTGARVIMACKDLKNCKILRRQIAIDSKNRQVVCRECDLSSFESIKSFAAKIIKEEPRIDVLINNAGLKFLKPRRTTRDSIEKQFGVNFLGHYLLTMLLKEKLEESAPARVVNVIGNAYTKGDIDFMDLNADLKYKPDKAYYQSKFAMALSTQEMSKEFDSQKVCVNGVDPGYTNTDIERHTEPFIRFFRNCFYWISRREPRQGAYPVLYTALSLDLHELTGKYISSKLTVGDFDQKCSSDPTLRRKIWLTARTWTHIENAKEEVSSILSKMADENDKTVNVPV